MKGLKLYFRKFECTHLRDGKSEHMNRGDNAWREYRQYLYSGL